MEISQIIVIVFAVAYFLESLSNFLLKKENKKLQLRNKKFEDALIEITDIAKANFYYLDCDYRWILEDILQLIRESEIKYES